MPGRSPSFFSYLSTTPKTVPRLEFRRWSPAALLLTRDFLFDLKIGRIVHAAELGRPNEIRLHCSLGMGLDEKAIEAIRRWRFEPATDGAPVTVKISLEVPRGTNKCDWPKRLRE
jgi:Gram-negative bacterial TonB protein C-terminal